MAIDDCELGCEHSHKSPEQLFRAMLVKTDSDCIGIRSGATAAVSTDCEQLSCDEAGLPTESILKKLFFENGDGCITLRTVKATP
jgi:hypothetical protein